MSAGKRPHLERAHSSDNRDRGTAGLFQMGRRKTLRLRWAVGGESESGFRSLWQFLRAVVVQIR